MKESKVEFLLKKLIYRASSYLITYEEFSKQMDEEYMSQYETEKETEKETVVDKKVDNRVIRILKLRGYRKAKSLTFAMLKGQKIGKDDNERKELFNMMSEMGLGSIEKGVWQNKPIVKFVFNINKCHKFLEENYATR